MADELIRKGEWQPLRQIGIDTLPDPREAKEEKAAASAPGMIDEPQENELTEKDGWQTLQAGGEDASPDNLEVKEEDLMKSFPEMIDEAQENYTDEQRQNLHNKINGMSTPEKFRLAIFANREVRSKLIHDPKKMIALAVLKNQKMNESEVLQYAQRKDLPEDVISTIAKEHKWQKHYPIKFAVVSNPKTPLAMALNLLPQLHVRDLKALSRDQNVASVLRRKAHDIHSPKKGK